VLRGRAGRIPGERGGRSGGLGDPGPDHTDADHCEGDTDQLQAETRCLHADARAVEAGPADRLLGASTS
jgi:hypothetical protein